MMSLDTPEICTGWRNILRISCARRWFFFTQLYQDARSTKHKIHINIILPYMHGSPKSFLSLRFLHQNPVHASTLCHTCYMPTHLILLNLITWTILGEECKSLIYKIIVPYVLIFKFLDSKLEDKRFCTKGSVHSLTSICS